MWEIRDYMVADLLEHFPEVHQEYNDKYNIVLDQLAEKIPKFKLLFKLGVF